MKQPTLRLIGVLVIALVLGTVAFAVAVAAQSPRDSQIPTVVTSGSANSTVAPSLDETIAPAPSAVATHTAVVKRATKPKAESNSDEKRRAPSEREVVTPKVRDDGDGDERGSGTNDSDSDNVVASGSAHSSSRAYDVPAIVQASKIVASAKPTHDHSIPQSTDRPRAKRTARAMRVGRDHSSGKNVRGTSN